MIRRIMSSIIFFLVISSSLVFARSAEWNLARYEPYYIKIKTALDFGDLEKAQDVAVVLVSAIRQAPDYGPTEHDIKFIEASGRRIISAKNVEQANQAFSSFTKVIERWKR